MKNIVNSSSELAKNYVEQTRNSIEADILLMVLDINNKSTLISVLRLRVQNKMIMKMLISNTKYFFLSLRA